MAAEARPHVIEGSNINALGPLEETAHDGPPLRIDIGFQGGNIDAAHARSDVVAQQVVPPHAAFS
jgi:hypothetical protein